MSDPFVLRVFSHRGTVGTIVSGVLVGVRLLDEVSLVSRRSPTGETSAKPGGGEVSTRRTKIYQDLGDSVVSRVVAGRGPVSAEKRGKVIIRTRPEKRTLIIPDLKRPQPRDH